MVWRAIYSEPRSELRARDELIALGVTALCPFDRVTRRVPRRRGLDGFRLETRDEPLWPRYLFADTDEIKLAEDTRGVSRVVKNIRGVPLRVPDAWIKLLLARVSNLPGNAGLRLVQDVSKPSHEFKPKLGDTVQVTDGGFSGFRAVIADLEKLDTQGVVGVRVVMFGAERSILLPYEVVGSIVRHGAKRAVERPLSVVVRRS